MPRLLLKIINKITIKCKAYYVNCILEELGFNSASDNPTYTHSSLSKEEILQNRMLVLNIFNIPDDQNGFELPYLYWIPKLHKIRTKSHSGSA